MTAGKDISLTGSVAASTKEPALSAGRNISIHAAEETKGSRITAGKTAAVIAKEDMTVKGSTVNEMCIRDRLPPVWL